MSLLARRKLISNIRLSPVRKQSTGGLSSGPGDVTYTITCPIAPVNGRMMIVVGGGVQSRTISTAMTGWTHQTISGTPGTFEMWYKKASGETTSLGQIVWSGALQGGWHYSEWDNMDDSPYFTHTVVSSALSFTLTYPTYYVPYGSVAIANLVLSSASNSWVLDNSFLNLAFASVGQNSLFKAGYRIYGDADPSETTAWSSANSRICEGSLVILNGKLA